MRYSAAIVLVLVAILSFAGCTGSVPRNTSPGSGFSGPGEVRVDVLIPLTGVAAPLGESSYFALQTAADDINQYYLDVGSPARVRLMFHDTVTDPATSLNLTREIHAAGGTTIVGYITSAELQEMKEFTDANGMFVLSSGSTAPDLAIPDDSIYRVVSDDTAQGRVMGSYLAGEGITAIVPVWRGDVYGDGLENATSSAFSAQGGVVLEGVRYLPGTTGFNATVASLEVLSGKAIEAYGADAVGIYAVTFSELSDIMTAAARQPNLSRVRWFGGDGNTGSPLLAGTTPAARFAAQAKLTGTIWGIFGSNPENNPVSMAIQERLGREPDGEALSLYDALWVVMAAKTDTGTTADPSVIARALTHHLDTYTGASMDLAVNPAGDRAMASYDVFEVVPGTTGSEWKRIRQVTMWPDGRKDEIAFP
jgi:branched-chain amino acid transport system substrate-binding protein